MSTSREPAIAVAQFAPVDDRAENLATLRSLTLRAVEQGAGLVLAPEYSSWFHRTMGPDWLTAAEPLDGPFVNGLADIAAEAGAIVVAGLVEVGTTPQRFRNTIVAVAPDGAVLAVSRKLHLYDAFGASESTWAEPGVIEPPQLFDALGLRVGIQTCYDVRFPEVTRRLVDAGAELVLVPSEWVAGPGKVHAWQTLVTARAIENTVFVAAADHAPPIGVGHSMVVDPRGERLAFIETASEVAIAPLDRSLLDEVRRINPALELRRFTVAPR